MIEDIDGESYITHGNFENGILKSVTGAQPLNIAPLPPTTKKAELLLTGSRHVDNLVQKHSIFGAFLILFNNTLQSSCVLDDLYSC